MELVDSKHKDNKYSLFYRSSRVFRVKNGWYFEDANGDPFGPFDSKDKTMQAVRIYRDVKQRGVRVPFDRVTKVL
ncbi:DUF6316 family protein [Pleionea sediminis]|uniref:DUF6316 family protein n=1 Tax=Pleionea sediminis TaxID=2569479 RepID=UPI001186ABB8|nr:DUF6316 family protein [Pleionea sediminis]